MLRERVIWIFIFTVVITTATAYVLPRAKHDKLIEKKFWIEKTFSSNSFDVVLLGDSRTYRGLDPENISEQLNGAEVLNFGYSSAGFSKMYIEEGIKKLSSQGKKIIVFCVTPYSLTAEAVKNEHYSQELSRKREELIEAYYFSEVLYFFRSTDPQYILKKKYLRANSEEFKPDYYHQEYNKRGWVASWKEKTNIQDALLSYEASFKKEQPLKSTTATIIKMVKKYKAAGFKIYGLRPPVHPHLLTLEEEMCKGAYDYFKSGFIEAGGNWLDLSITTYKTYDGSHLDKAGAINYSKMVGEKIKNADR